MTAPAQTLFPHRHLLGIEGLSAAEISLLLDLSEDYVELNRQFEKKRAVLRGRTLINVFFESSTRTRTSFELAGKRLGGDVINISIRPEEHTSELQSLMRISYAVLCLKNKIQPTRRTTLSI